MLKFARSPMKDIVKEEEQLDEDINEMLDDGGTGQQSMETAFDSIMDDSQEEDEVNDLLATD